MVSTRSSMGESSRTKSRRKFERSHSNPESEKDKLIKETLKKVYEKLIHDPDEQLKNLILENLKNVIENGSKSEEPRKRRNSTSDKSNSPKRIRRLVADSSSDESDDSDNSNKESDGNSKIINSQNVNLKDFQINVKKLTYKEIVEIAGIENSNCELLKRLKNKERSHPDQLENLQEEGIEIQIEEIPDYDLDDDERVDQLEEIDEPPQFDLDFDDNSSSDYISLHEPADIAKDPQTEYPIIELDDEDCRLAKVNARVSELIEDLTSELSQDSTSMESQKKFTNPNEVIVIDDDEDDDDIKQNQPVKTSTAQKSPQILVINKQKLKELLEKGNSIQSIYQKFGLNLNNKNKQQQGQSIPESSKTPQPEIANIPSTSKTNLVPENAASNANDNSNKTNAKTIKTRQLTFKVFQLPNNNLEKIVKPSEGNMNSKTYVIKPYKVNLSKPITISIPESSCSTAKNTNVEPVQVDSVSSTSIRSELTTNVAPSKPQLTNQKESVNLVSQKARTMILSPLPSTSKVSEKPVTVAQRVANNSLNKPARRESMLRVKSFANECLIPNFKSNENSSPHQAAQPSVNEPIRWKIVHQPIPLQKPGLSRTIAANQSATRSVNLSSSSRDLIPVRRTSTLNAPVKDSNARFIKELEERRNRGKLRPWIKESKPEPYYEMRKELLSCVSLHADYKCMNLKCAFYTSSAKYFEIHLERHILENPFHTILACPYCRFKSTNVHGLIQHIDVCHEYDRFICPYCFYRALDSSNVIWHIKQFHHDQPKMVFELENKKKFLKLNRELTYEAMRKFVPPLLCKFCDQKCMHFEMFINHIESHTNASNFKFPCVVCGVHVTKERLVQHMKNCHGYGEYQCVNCVFGCDDINLMRRHLANEHPSRTVIIVLRKFQQGAKTIFGDPTHLTLVKASTKVGTGNFRIFKYPLEALLNTKNVLKTDLQPTSQTNFDQAVPRVVIKNPNANSTVTSKATTKSGQQQIGKPTRFPVPNGVSKSVPQPPKPNFIKLNQQQIAKLTTAISSSVEAIKPKTHQQQRIETTSVVQASPQNFVSPSPDQIVVPKISNVFSFQQVPF